MLSNLLFSLESSDFNFPRNLFAISYLAIELMIVPYEIYYVTDVLPAAHNWTSPKTKFIICFVIKRSSSKWCRSLSQSPILIQTPVAAFPGEMCSVASAVIFPGEFRGRTDEKGDEKGGCR